MAQIKKYIFGYGSLMSPAEINYTLGRSVEILYPVRLNGWIRDWSVVCANTSQRQFSFTTTGLKPDYVAALNVRLPLPNEIATNPNGVLFEVDDEDIIKMDQREKHYDRVIINDYLDAPPEGIIYAYTGAQNHLYFNKPVEHEVIIPTSYLQTVADSARSLGEDFFADYQHSTLTPICETKECLLSEAVLPTALPL